MPRVTVDNIKYCAGTDDEPAANSIQPSCMVENYKGKMVKRRPKGQCRVCNKMIAINKAGFIAAHQPKNRMQYTQSKVKVDAPLMVALKEEAERSEISVERLLGLILSEYLDIPYKGRRLYL